MTVLLHLEDNYLRKFEAKIVTTSPPLLVLDKTTFYPRGGGQESDYGTLEIDSESFRVVDCFKKGSEVFHKIEGENISVLKEGEIVRGEIDWDRRYKMMRYHSAQHLISAIALEVWEAVTAGNQIHEKRSRIDFLMESGNPIDFEELFKMSNEEMAKNHPVNVFFLDRNEAENKLNPKRSRLDMVPKSVKRIRIVEIEGFDKCACGGTHVANTSEIGKMHLVKKVNKGKGIRRIEFIVE